MPSPNPGSTDQPIATLHAVDAVSPREIYAVGGYNGAAAGGTDVLVMRWDGTAPDDVWAVGQSGDFTGTGAYVADFDGSGWSVVEAPHQTSFGADLRSVVAVAPDDAWAAGFYDDEQGDTQPLLIHWDGSSRTQVTGAGIINDFVALAPDDVYGVGAETLVHRDGTSWSLVADAAFEEFAGFLGVDHLAGCDLVSVGRTAGSALRRCTGAARRRSRRPATGPTRRRSRP